MRKLKYDYYTVDLSWCADDFTEDELSGLAIDEARERARLYVMPCEWRVKKLEKYGQYRVTRVRR